MEYGKDKDDNTLIYNYCQAAYQLGDIYEREKNKKEAVSYYKTAIKYANKMEEKSYQSMRALVVANSEQGIKRCKK
jgi:ABC-type enterochelin transport system substrate-binding protein